ncbi:NAD(P)H steroid dehydrogenase-like protein in alkane synthesis cluster [Serinicoccus hydrothermalis]|uniref:NAD(P)H steroid dehydrogenase-like protein in alkane synthesis cluster n=1 Tax=Serinicoccus hydrothermalis TaxID=1758689 RepID=A0A1B1NBA8_9MICO|nr:NAD-dependent epimerase/dehydratase family protein [Serinicoccus hydrothermalis]ANS78717.1 NAD(P)H steroid dehydrogenase-like protein in alkane synthesis cluster [Serinicoccus hydrothermalis]
MVGAEERMSGRVLVTGASGMLGGAVADLLATRGWDVTVMQRRTAGGRHREVLGDVRDAEAVARAVDGQDAVVHLAAKVDVVGPWRDFVDINVRGTRRVIEALRAQGGGRLVQVSSPSVAHTGSSLAGAGAGPASPMHARGHYARTKAAAELFALAADTPDLPVTALRPHLVWGPGDTQLVGRIAQRARQGRLALVGPGTTLVDTTYVDNAAAAIVAALERSEVAHGQALVVTNGEPRPIGELIGDICRAVGAPAPRLHLPTPLAWGLGAAVEGVTALSARVPGIPTVTQPPLTRFLAEQLSTAHWFDQRRTREVLDWRPAVSLDEGLDRL